MENANDGGAGDKAAVGNPTSPVSRDADPASESPVPPPLSPSTPNANGGGDGDSASVGNPNHPASESPAPAARRPLRAPFTGLSQVDSDLALARALQEQERAYMMLRMNAGDGSDYASSENGSYLDDDEEVALGEYEDDDEEVGEYEDDERETLLEEERGIVEDDESDYEEYSHDGNEDTVDPNEFESDEAYARALQDAEEQEVATRLMALTGLNDWRVENHGYHGSNSQDAWEDVDPDELSYEELIALGEVVGTESRGLSADTIASLPSTNYKAQSVHDGNTDQCVICRLDYEDGDSLVVLSCKHIYHPECINKWLQINKVCPVCSAEVSTSGSTEED